MTTSQFFLTLIDEGKIKLLSFLTVANLLFLNLVSLLSSSIMNGQA